MRITLSAAILFAALAATLTKAQQPVTKAFSSAADVKAMVEKAEKERKPDQPNFIQQILQAPPYNVNLEYRVQGIDTNPNIHEVEAEMVYVVEGAGVITLGGKLVNERRTNDKNKTGDRMEGGTPRRIAKGDYVMIPENTSHSFTKVEGRLVILSLHLPRTAEGH